MLEDKYSMDIIPDYGLIEKIKARLKASEDITYSTHFFDELKVRPITEFEIKEILWNPKTLMHAEAQKDDVDKYRLFFRKARNYDSVIVVKFVNNKIKVITARIQYRKRVRLKEKWRKRLNNRR